MAFRRTLCALVAVSLLLGASANSIYYVDTPSSSFLHIDSKLDTITAPLYKALASSVLSLRPSSSISTETSEQLNAVLKPTPFKHPKLFLSVNFLGSETDLLDVLKSSFKGSSVKAFDSSSIDTTTILNALPSLYATNKHARFAFLGATHTQVPASVLEAEVNTWAAAVGAAYRPGSTPLTGKLQLGEDTVLDCAVEEDKAVVSEIAHLYAQLTASLATAGSSEKPHVVSLTVTSLHGVSLKYGVNSAQYSDVLEAVIVMISTALHQEKSLVESTIVQVATVPLSATDAATTIVGSVQRSLKQAAPGDEPAVLRSKQFSIKAAAYGSFLLLLYFTFAGIYCMCTMKFKEDSLLFPRQKQD